MYNFKVNSKVYIVYGGTKYNIDVYPDISFSQTFNESAVKVKTLHSQFNMFDGAVINTANPANFNFTIPITEQTDMQIVYDLLIDYDLVNTEAVLKTADIYVESDTEIFKLEKCVVESGVFNINQGSLLTISISGTAAKLSRFIGTIPGTTFIRSENITFSRINKLGVYLNDIEKTRITNLSIELRNDISWISHETLHKSLAVNGASDTMYPEAFVVTGRLLAGNIQQYVTEDNSETINTWEIGPSLRIVADSDTHIALDIRIPSIVYTNRLDVQNFYVQTFDFRMNSNVQDVSTIFNNTRPSPTLSIGGIHAVWAAI